MTSSLLFVGTMCGFTAGALLVPHIMRFLSRFYLSNPKLALFSPFRIAFSKPSPSDIGHSASQARYLVVILGSFGAPTTFVLMGSQTGLPTMFLAYVVVSFGRAVLTAPLNMFLSKLPNRPLGYAYASWGFGAVVSPLVFQVTAAAGLPWAHFYFGSLVIAATSLTFLGITFMPTGREFAMDRKHALDEANSRSKCSPPLTPDSDDLHESDVSSDSLSHLQSIPTELRLVVFMPSLWAVSLFAILYCGSETTTQGLIVQYLLAERSANPNTVGYVTAGFWAGISVSRLAWSFFSPKFSYTGRKYIVQGSLAFAMQLFIWFIDSNIENAVSCSLIGVFFGPMWPAILELTNDLLPVEVKLISMAIVYASVLLPIFPFITGVVVTKYSMRCWSYITVSQVALLFIGWFLFPTAQPPRRSIAQ
ncbi:major facilitator superfamily domain-containing protein [Mycena maculata]|uniref:Major facilitator superfamily domain-containing protein n=1 Tax=Mycena maculata TaxID=230809 RepID=A0AAD7KDU7_9AGAR|nr:major facilitator superfamily domain-containing protein [Mycena maculata]